MGNDAINFPKKLWRFADIKKKEAVEDHYRLCSNGKSFFLKIEKIIIRLQ